MKTTKRIFWRTLFLLGLTFITLYLMIPMTQLTGSMEVLRCLKAMGVLAWFEHTGFCYRLIQAPKLDMQQFAIDASFDRRGAAMIYAVEKAAWAYRVSALILLYWIV